MWHRWSYGRQYCGCSRRNHHKGHILVHRRLRTSSKFVPCSRSHLERLGLLARIRSRWYGTRVLGLHIWEVQDKLQLRRVSEIPLMPNVITRQRIFFPQLQLAPCRNHIFETTIKLTSGWDDETRGRILVRMLTVSIRVAQKVPTAWRLVREWTRSHRMVWRKLLGYQCLCRMWRIFGWGCTLAAPSTRKRTH